MTTHVIRGGRGSGKTLMLIQLSCEKQIPILVANQFMADALVRQAQALGFKNLPKPFAVHDAFHKDKFVGTQRDILIDDLDCVFNTIFRDVDVHAVTYTPAWNECDLDKMNEEARMIIEKPLTDKDFIKRMFKGDW